MSNKADHRKLLREDPEAFLRQSLLDQLAVLHVVTTQDLLGDDPEVLHDFRVAIRTLRSRLKFYAPYFKKPRRILAWSKELKWIDTHSQTLRDLDVQIELLQIVAEDRLQNLMSKPAKYQDYRKQVLTLRSELVAAVDIARVKLAETLESKRKTEFFAEFKTGLLLAELKPKKVADINQDLSSQLKMSTQAIDQKLARPNLQSQSSKKLHTLRLDCKRARYLAEAIGADSRELVRIQDLLGQINDLAVLNNWLKSKVFARRRQRKVLLSLVLQTNALLEKQRALLGEL